MLYLRKCIWILVLITLMPFTTFSQSIDSISISLLTHGADDQIYTTFGHSAIRIQIPSAGIDDVYNYGVFDFQDPQFLMNFVLGKLNYYLGKEPFLRYIQEYRQSGRFTHEQVLNLNNEQNKNLYNSLLNNAKEENKYYRYDFIFDNCSSRILKIINQQVPGIIWKNNLNPKHQSYKQIINTIYQEQQEYWTGLGVDILLAAKTREVPNSEQMCFVPAQLESYVAGAILESKPLVKSYFELTPQLYVPQKEPWIFRPYFVLAFLSFVVWLLFWKYPKFTLPYSVLFGILGLLGIIIVYLSLGTEHRYFSGNINLFWANPLLILWLILPNSKKSFLNRILSICYLGVLIIGIFKPSLFPNEILPLAFVSWFIFRNLRKRFSVIYYNKLKQ